MKISAIENLDKFIIGVIDEKEIQILKENKISYKVLDKEPFNKLYYLIWLSPISDIKNLEKFGDILLKEENLIIIRLKKEPTIEFFSNKWQVKRINFKEIKLKHSKEFKSEKSLRGNPLIEQIISRINQDSIVFLYYKITEF